MPTADAPARPRYRLWPVPLGVFLIIWGLTTHGKFSLTGDEPHYLLMAESLRVDGDLDLANDYAPAPGDQRRYVATLDGVGDGDGVGQQEPDRGDGKRRRDGTEHAENAEAESSESHG